MTVTVHPLTAARWRDFEALFGPRGACAGCWCMYYRLPGKQFHAGKGAKNKRAMKKIVDGGEIPGLLAYVDGVPAGWVSMAPRESFPRLERSRVLARVDDRPVWSVVCFFVHKDHRKRGLTGRLLDAAAAWAGRQGAALVEGYPLDTAKEVPSVFAWNGFLGAFERARFEEVARRSPARPIVRRRLERGKGA